MKTVLLHSFTMSDCEDVEIYAAEPIYQWQQTEAGQWCMKHAKDLHWLTSIDHNTYSHRINIIGYLEEQDLTYYLLRWKK